MSTIEERTAYLENPDGKQNIYGNFNPFYVTIAICTVFGVFIIALNINDRNDPKHKSYWQDRNTGNRWLISIWSGTPHKQPPLDLTELKDASFFQPHNPDVERPVEYTVSHQRPQYNPAPARSGPPQGYHREEYVELQKRESDI
uniref:Putative conserved plasma membrane protein n=1 Tax=Anopheles darlingi TaxID=43151 RepID=A0A2M4CU42_ANODA